MENIQVLVIGLISIIQSVLFLVHIYWSKRIMCDQNDMLGESIEDLLQFYKTTRGIMEVLPCVKGEKGVGHDLREVEELGEVTLRWIHDMYSGRVPEKVNVEGLYELYKDENERHMTYFWFKVFFLAYQRKCSEVGA